MVYGNAVLANAMWRTGSTYLSSRFADSSKYMMFYEPDHEAIGSFDVDVFCNDHAGDYKRLNHPAVEGGYWGSYSSRDPKTGKPLVKLHAPAMGLRDVYSDASAQSLRFLDACKRVAESKSRVPFFGFCRSGTQHKQIDDHIQGLVIHLFRDPREQFASYDWPSNDYFVPGTIAQLLMSDRTYAKATRIAPHIRFGLGARLLKALPDQSYKMMYRVARLMSRGIDPAIAYSLFYLSWLVSFSSARETAALSFSLSEIAASPPRLRHVQEALGVKLDQVRPTPSAIVSGLDYAALERSVERLIG